MDFQTQIQNSLQSVADKLIVEFQDSLVDTDFSDIEITNETTQFLSKIETEVSSECNTLFSSLSENTPVEKIPYLKLFIANIRFEIMNNSARRLSEIRDNYLE